MRKNHFYSCALIAAALALLSAGCAGPIKNMREVPDEQATFAPDPGKAMIVFMRPAWVGGGIQSSVFHIVRDTPKLAGIVASKTKTAYQVEPGKHLFMVIGENADFMDAQLLAGKTYYALATPRPGMWKARFSLRPVHEEELGTEEFDEWNDACRWVEKTAESDQWAFENMDSIREKQTAYLAKWADKPLAERPKLYPQDGR